MEPRTKGVIAAVILMVAIPAALATFLTEVGPGSYRPIDVRTQDGQVTDVPQTSVSVYCGWGGGTVQIDALIPTAYVNSLGGQGLSDLNDELCNGARAALDKAVSGEDNE